MIDGLTVVVCSLQKSGRVAGPDSTDSIPSVLC